MKILLIADKEDWILGTIARALKENIRSLEIDILYSDDRSSWGKFLKNQWRYDVIHFMYQGSYLVMKKYLYRPCAVNLWHLDDPSQAAEIFTNLQIDVLCIPSHQWFEKTKEYVPGNLAVFELKYGIETASFVYQSRAKKDFLDEHGLPENTLVLGFAGNARLERKGIPLLLTSLLALKKRIGRGFVCRMTGKLTSIEIPAELKDNIIACGFLPREEMPGFYSSLDYYLGTSEIEGYGYPVLEAMCCERVVVTTPVGVAPEIIRQGENGYILQAENFVDEFIKIVNNMDNQAAIRLGKAAREAVVSTLSWEAIARNNQYKEFYEEARRHFRKKPFGTRMKTIFGAFYRYYHKQIRGW
jgi:glycosyltransferase involved in cell wall biosynthesis